MGQEFNAKILRDVENRRDFVAQLKANSKPWPRVHVKHGSNFEIFLSTLVRIEREGKWYLVHLVKSARVEISGNIEWLYEQLIHEAHLIQNFYKVSETLHLDDLDPDQRPEQERLKTSGDYPQLRNV